MMTPSEKKSVLCEYTLFYNDYGAMYIGVPTLMSSGS